MAKKILIVRTSSLGDLVHMLPAISDIARYVPEAHIDWVVEEAFAEIPAWHPKVQRVFTVAHRRWRKNWWQPQVRAERRAFKEEIGAQHYDVILDMQALMKSIWVVRQTHGPRHGLNWKSAREPLASLFYQHKYAVDFWQPAVKRQRLLASQVFGYDFKGAPDYGLADFRARNPVQNYATIMPSASRDDKLWAAEKWHQIFDYLIEQGLTLRLFAGSEPEVQRAQMLIKDYTGHAQVLPRSSLTEVANQLAGARVMVGLDSGLTHLSAGLGRPTVGIYKASTPTRTPLISTAYTASLGDRGQDPSAQMVLAATQAALQSES